MIPQRKGEDAVPSESIDRKRKTAFTREDEILSAAFASEAGKEFKQCTQYADSWRMQQLCQKFSTYSPMLETKDEMGSTLGPSLEESSPESAPKPVLNPIRNELKVTVRILRFSKVILTNGY
jgi:hypothetical protein